MLSVLFIHVYLQLVPYPPVWVQVSKFMLLTYFSDGLRNIMIHQYMGADLESTLLLLGPVATFTAIGVLTKLREGQEAQRRLVDEIFTFIVIIQ